MKDQTGGKESQEIRRQEQDWSRATPVGQLADTTDPRRRPAQTTARGRSSTGGREEGPSHDHAGERSHRAERGAGGCAGRLTNLSAFAARDAPPRAPPASPTPSGDATGGTCIKPSGRLPSSFPPVKRTGNEAKAPDSNGGAAAAISASAPRDDTCTTTTEETRFASGKRDGPVGEKRPDLHRWSVAVVAPPEF